MGIIDPLFKKKKEKERKKKEKEKAKVGMGWTQTACYLTKNQGIYFWESIEKAI